MHYYYCSYPVRLGNICSHWKYFHYYYYLAAQLLFTINSKNVSRVLYGVCFFWDFIAMPCTRIVKIGILLLILLLFALFLLLCMVSLIMCWQCLLLDLVESRIQPSVSLSLSFPSACAEIFLM